MLLHIHTNSRPLLYSRYAGNQVNSTECSVFQKYGCVFSLETVLLHKGRILFLDSKYHNVTTILKHSVLINFFLYSLIFSKRYDENPPRWCPGIFSDLLRSVQMLKRVWGAESYPIYSILYMVKLQPWFLNLRWETCLRQNCSLGSCVCGEGLPWKNYNLRKLSFEVGYLTSEELQL